jgi:hypothetical protein
MLVGEFGKERTIPSDIPVLIDEEQKIRMTGSAATSQNTVIITVRQP